MTSMDDPELAADTRAQPPSIADGIERRLDPRVMALARTSAWIFNAVVMAGGFLALLISWLAAGPTLAGVAWRAAAWLGPAAALTWLAERWPQIDYRYTSYRVDDLGIEIRRGVFWRAVINVPRSRVQHTDVSQGPLERRFGLRYACRLHRGHRPREGQPPGPGAQPRIADPPAPAAVRTERCRLNSDCIRRRSSSRSEAF